MHAHPHKLFVYECRGDLPPLGEPQDAGFLGLWPETPFYYLFFDREAADCVAQWLQGLQGWTLENSYELDYDQWQQAPGAVQRIGPFVIEKEGVGEEHVVSGDEIRIRLNPGLVFGSGLHETTRGCLLAVAYAFEKLEVRSVVDLGTGSGILALAAALLGASRVSALDCNPLAVSVARKNVAENGLEGAVEMVVAAGLSVLRRPSDLLLMNIEWPCLLDVVRGGDWLAYPYVVMSGFLESQWPHLEKLLPPDRHVISSWVLDDWMTVLISK